MRPYKPLRRLLAAVSPIRVVVLGYLLIILLGALLLMLPAASRARGGVSIMTALFTSTASTCITGLVLTDVYTFWAPFGQIVILCLVQIGGLGFMTVATLMSLMIGRDISLKERLAMQSSLNLRDISGVVRITRKVLLGTLMLEAAGAITLCTQLVPQFGWGGGAAKSVFVAVSAFCNAGVDLFGQIAPGSSLSAYRANAFVNITVMALIITGGIGFAVWEDITVTKKPRKYSLYTKLTLSVSAMLILIGAVAFLIFEWDNGATMRGLPVGEKVLVSFFQSVAARTAGFNTIDIMSMTRASKVVLCLLMFIGGSSGSTAGGVKTVTFAILALTVYNALRGRKEVVIRGRSVGNETVFKAIGITGATLAALVAGTLAVALLNPGEELSAVFFECLGALTTVGFASGIAEAAGAPTHAVLMLLMFMGRVGLLTISMSLILKSDKDKVKVMHPEGRFLIG